MSGLVFYKLYQKPTYETWCNKSNPKYPPIEMVREEIIQTAKGTASATLCPAISIWLTSQGYSQAYCGWGPSPGVQYSGAYMFLTFLMVWFGNDFWSFYYHRMGHTTKLGWSQHRFHHHFGNPSPFAVIADEYLDQFIRAMPIFLFPMMVPMNIDMVFATYGIFFYAYGVYLHCGYEIPYISAHQNYINTSFQHYLHHARSSMNLPYHTGFYFKIWDQLFGSTYQDTCICAQCDKKIRKQNQRTLGKSGKERLLRLA